MITNKYGLPEAFVNFAKLDKYSKGDADISVTQLIDSPRVLLMREEHKDKLSTDAMDMVFALFGTAVHSVLEGATGKNTYKEQRINKKVNDWILSGAIDQYDIEEDGIVITDYKVTSVWSVIFSKQEWVNQLNVYAFLLEKELGIPVKTIQICAILRDWNRKQASLKPDYPQHPIEVVDIPLWSLEERTEYVEDRMSLHQNARQLFDQNERIVRCNKQERWSKDDKWAVKKKGRKTAVKVFDNQDDAEELASTKDTYVEFRQGENSRCVGNYCGVAEFCSQFMEEKNGQGKGL